MPTKSPLQTMGFKFDVVIVAIVTAVFIIVELVIGLNVFIWLDEAFTLNSTAWGASEAVSRAVIFEGQPPVYFFLLSLWRIVDDSYQFARIFSIVAVAVSIPIFYAYVRRHFKQTSAWFLTLMFAFNPMTIWAGLEIRVYALIILFSVVLIWLFQSTYTKSQIAVPRRILFICVSLLAVHTHYYFSFLLLINGAYLLFYNRNNLFKYVVDMIIPAGSLAVYLFFLPNQVDVHSVGDSTNTLGNFVMFCFYMLRAYVFPFPKIFDNNNINMLFFIVSLLVLVLILWRNKKILRRFYQKEWSYPVFLIVALLVVYTLLFFVLGEAAISPRHGLFILTPLVVVLISSLWVVASKSAKTSMLGLIFSLYVIGVFAKAPDYGKDQAILKVHEAMEADKNSDSPKLFYFGENALVYRFLSSDSAIYSIPAHIDLTVKYEHRDWFIKDEKQLVTFFETFDSADTLWIIDTSPDLIGVDFMQNRFGVDVNYQMLDNYINDNYNVLTSQSFDEKYRLRKVIKMNRVCAE